MTTGTRTEALSTATDMPSGDAEELAAAVPAPPRSRYVWVGLLVIAGILAVLTALFTLTDSGTFRGRYTITAVVPNAAGIRGGDPIRLRGVNIGRVRGFELTEEGVAIGLEIENDFRVPADSRVVLRSGGLLGGTIARIIPGDSDRLLEGGEVIPGVSPAAASGGLGGISERAEEVIGRVELLLAEPTIAALRESATELRTLLNELSTLAERSGEDLNSLGQSLQRSAEGLERAVAGPELARAVVRIDSTAAHAARAAATLERTGASLDSILVRIERGEGTIGLLAQDEALYHNLNRTLTSLRTLLDDIRLHPDRYINVDVF